MTIKTETKSKIRPYWHVDAKWISGLFFMFFLGLTLFAFGLYTLTNEKNGIDTMTKMVTIAFSRDGLDSEKDINEFKQKIENSPDKTAKPNAALNITISKSEIEGKTPREIRFAIFRKIATPIYFDGKGAEDVLNTPEARANFEKDTTLLRFFSEKSHKMIGRILTGLALLSAVFLSLVVYFSYRVGRIANPAFIIVASTWFWAIFFTALSYITKDFSADAITFGAEGPGYGTMITPYIRELLPDIMKIFSKIYLAGFLTGLALLVLSGIIALALKIRIKKAS